IILLSFYLFCKKESSKQTTLLTSSQPIEPEINVKRITDLTGIKFEILKTETIGYIPIHKFYWICLENRATQQQVRELAKEIIDDIIAKKPNTYHSFTIHFFYKDEMGKTLEESEPFAKATFLPEGNWLKVGRVPINNYKSYKLTCVFYER
ncbi:hypothetical protein NLD30_11735, partial [SCandidatus Aminicenantes bacterium Aminicenantia_JdfR_composite]|nr:hypothetical protein [SCandidatus Aminicenantes bacterium Aminicenantia_JdfR_composite]